MPLPTSLHLRCRGPGRLSGAFARAGRTVVTPTSDLRIDQNNRTFKIKDSPTLDDVVRGMNELGLAPGDLVAILEALKEAGALHAELIVI